MNINQLQKILQEKIERNINIEGIKIEDKTGLHTKHFSHQPGKFHIKLSIKSKYLNKINKIQGSKKIYQILDFEIKNYIHSIQILIN